MDIVKGRSVRSDAIAWTMLSCSGSGISAICFALTRPTAIRLGRICRSTRMRRHRALFIPLVALCRRHFSVDFITNMSEFDFRQAHPSENDGGASIFAGGQLALCDSLIEFGPTDPRDDACLGERQTFSLQFALNAIHSHSSVTARTTA